MLVWNDRLLAFRFVVNCMIKCTHNFVVVNKTDVDFNSLACFPVIKYLFYAIFYFIWKKKIQFFNLAYFP